MQCSDCKDTLEMLGEEEKRSEALSDVLNAILDWVESDTVQGAFVMAAIHGYAAPGGVSAARVQDMFDEAYSLVERERSGS